MGNALLFSQLEKFLNEQAETVPGCIVDTQFLIAILYEVHPFYEDADFVFRVLAQKGIPIFATVTTRSEFIDIQRKIIITEALMDMTDCFQENCSSNDLVWFHVLRTDLSQF